MHCPKGSAFSSASRKSAKSTPNPPVSKTLRKKVGEGRGYPTATAPTSSNVKFSAGLPVAFFQLKNSFP
jgi:hypothetical protein